MSQIIVSLVYLSFPFIKTTTGVQLLCVKVAAFGNKLGQPPHYLMSFMKMGLVETTYPQVREHEGKGL